MQDRTVGKVLNQITEYLMRKGIESPRLTAELLVSGALGVGRIDLYTRPETVLDDRAWAQLQDLAKRAGQNEPVEYLLGKTEFYFLEMIVEHGCVIPRPETELLVEKAIEFLRDRPGQQLVCDLCTGSGCVAVAIACNCPNVRLIATDISAEAIDVAGRNIEKYHLKDQITLLQGDLFEPLKQGGTDSKYDLIVSNPPYVSTAEYEDLEENVRNYEPKEALLAGADGLDVHSRIIESANMFLKPDAALMLEIGYKQGQAVRQLLEKTAVFQYVGIAKDFSGHDRIAIAVKANQ
ncbi:MAG TPA: peptide chain release factor N(5)-glutamine methyltransferase [Sedimentisphaerales bacterium]|nr:peptide chain release factor N(5)-glutamine methyltransferase [Sedimentisphaerales bacterium]